MVRRLLFPAYTYAWFATLATMPPIVSLMFWPGSWPSATESLLILLSGYPTALLFWGVPASASAVIVWPLAKRFLLGQTISGWLAALARTAFGIVLGAALGFVVYALFLAANILALPNSPVNLKLASFMEGVLHITAVGAITGSVFAAWFQIFVRLIGADRPEQL